MWTCTQAVGSIFPYRAVIRQDLNCQGPGTQGFPERTKHTGMEM